MWNKNGLETSHSLSMAEWDWILDGTHDIDTVIHGRLVSEEATALVSKLGSVTLYNIEP